MPVSNKFEVLQHPNINDIDCSDKNTQPQSTVKADKPVPILIQLPEDYIIEMYNLREIAKSNF